MASPLPVVSLTLYREETNHWTHLSFVVRPTEMQGWEERGHESLIKLDSHYVIFYHVTPKYLLMCFELISLFSQMRITSSLIPMRMRANTLHGHHIGECQLEVNMEDEMQWKIGTNTEG